MSQKGDALFWNQVREAVKAVRAEANTRSEFDAGMQSGASMVAVRLLDIQRRDAALKADGIPRGAE